MNDDSFIMHDATGNQLNHSADSKDRIEAAVREILTSVGEDPSRQGLERTPNRVARMYDELLAGYSVDPIALVNDALFDIEYDEMIIVKDIEFFSMCEHHMLPFFGRAHVQEGHWSVEDSTHCRDVCPPPASAGANDPTDSRSHL